MKYTTNMEIRKYGNTEIWKYGNVEIWKYGNMGKEVDEAWCHGSSRTKKYALG